MLIPISLISLSIILQLLINAADENRVGKNSNNETNLSNSSASKKSIRTGYLTFKDTKKVGKKLKKGDGNTKKGIQAAKNSNYLTLDAKKTFNHL